MGEGARAREGDLCCSCDARLLRPSLPSLSVVTSPFPPVPRDALYGAGRDRHPTQQRSERAFPLRDDGVTGPRRPLEARGGAEGYGYRPGEALVGGIQHVPGVG